MLKAVTALLCLLLLPLLSGCMLLNAAITAGGYCMGGPLEYAGTAATLCEYGYEYAVNDKTPDDVLMAKFAFMLERQNRGEGRWETALDRRGEPSALAGPDLGRLAVLYAPLRDPDITDHGKRRLIFIEAPAQEPAALAENLRPAAAPAPVRQKAASPARPSPAAAEAPALVADLDPLRGFWPSGESLARPAGEPEVRISLPAEHTGITGGWSIRHPVSGPSS